MDWQVVGWVAYYTVAVALLLYCWWPSSPRGG